MTLAGLSPAGALIVRAGEPKTLHVFLKDREGNVQDLAGRTLSLVIRRTADRHPLFTIGAELSGDAKYFVVSIPAQTASGITDAGLRQSLSHDLVETTGGGSVTRWTERVAVVEGPEMPDLPPVSVDLPFSQAVISPHAIVVSERGATGQSAAIQLYLAGHIDAPTVEAMEAWLSSISEDAANAVLADLVARLERLENLGVGDVADLAEAVAQLTQQVSDNNDGSAAADQALGDRIDQSDDARIAGDAALGQRIDATEGAMAAADEALGQRIDQSDDARVAGDDALGLRIDATEGAMAAADEALGQRIDQGDAARMAADEALGARVDLADQHIAAEVERSTAVDQAHAGRLVLLEEAIPPGATIAERLAALDVVLKAQPNGKIYGGPVRLQSGASAPEVPTFGYLGPQNLVTHSVGGGRRRQITDRFLDQGVNIDDHFRNNAMFDTYGALSRAVKIHPRVMVPGLGYFVASRILSSLLNGTVLEALASVSASGAPTFIFTNGADRMLTGVAGSRNIRLRGSHHWTYREKSTGSSFAFDLTGVSGFYADFLAITNANNGMLIPATASDVYINHLHIEADVALNVAVGCTRVRIGRITGSGSVSVPAGADCVIGAELAGLLPGLATIAPVASKALIYDANGAPSLTDWIMNGTWVPTISVANMNDAVISYSSQSGILRKRGTLIEVGGVISFTPQWNTASGNLQLSLPYVADGATSLSALKFTTLPATAVWPNTATELLITPAANLNYASILGLKNGGSTAATSAMFPSGTSYTIRFRGLYGGG